MTVSKEPSFTIGIEEEYLLVDTESRNLITDCPPNMFSECENLLEGQVTPEFLQSQIEVGSRVMNTLPDARDELARLRTTVAQVAEQYGMAIIAASTHPFALWDIGIEDEDLRIDLLNQTSYILPHLLALSTSSPFWRGEDTGLKSYRVAVWNELPRTGLPEQFDSYGEYRRFVDVMVNAGLIEDSTKIWWDIRPSHRFPTLEMRIADLCTCLDDSICIAALYRCWLRMLYRLKVNNQRWRTYSRYLINENRWRAQRYGVDKGLVDFGRGEIVPFIDLLDELLELIAEDAEYFDCQAQVEHARSIVSRGTSAHWQLSTYQQALADGADHDDALKLVVDMLVKETLRDL
jgi:carboxylate-amine ligase